MIGIIGAGISGLSLGHYLKKNGINDFVILDEEKNHGGKIQTTYWKDFHLESGPNTLLSTPLLLDFIKELGLKDKILSPDEAVVKNRFIKLNGKTTLLPSSPQKLLFNGLLDVKSKFSILKDLRFKPATVPQNETVEAFFSKHFTPEIVDKLVTPFCRGIYASEPNKLLIKSTFPKLANYQEEFGSIIKGLKKNKSIEKRQVFLLQGGMKSIISALTHELKDNLYTEEVTAIEKSNDQFYVKTSSKDFVFDHVIITCPAKVASKLVKQINPTISQKLANINYAQLNVLHRIYDTQSISFPYLGFGALYTKPESKRVLGQIWNSNIVKRKDNKFLITTMFRGELDDELKQELDTIFAKDYSLNNDCLLHENLAPWKRAIPVYDENHCEFLSEYREEKGINLYFCSNLVNGVSIPDRIAESKKLAESLIK